MALFTIDIEKTRQEAVEYIATYIDDKLELPAVIDAVDYGFYCAVANLVIKGVEEFLEGVGILEIRFADED
jgi:hypothetical protein